MPTYNALNDSERLVQTQKKVKIITTTVRLLQIKGLGGGLALKHDVRDLPFLHTSPFCLRRVPVPAGRTAFLDALQP